jgi:AraC family ethanolamine operon transcriptional activator
MTDWAVDGSRQLREVAPPSAATICSVETDDVDHQAAQLNGWNQDYAQMSVGRFTGRLRKMDLSQLSLFVESTSQALLQRGTLDRRVVALGVPVIMPHGAVFCGSRASGQGLHIFSGRGGFEFYSPPGLIMSAISADLSELALHLTRQEQEAIISDLDRPYWASCDQDSLGQLRDFVSDVIETGFQNPALLADPAHLRMLRSTAFDKIAQLLSLSFAPYERINGLKNRWKVVMTVRDLVLSRPDDPVTIAELCAEVGVSRRTLQYCFQDALGIGPLDFMLSLRLMGARRMLRRSATVTDAAVHWGFWHFGHFSKNYRAMFGELPSQTHKRHAEGCWI